MEEEGNTDRKTSGMVIIRTDRKAHRAAKLHKEPNSLGMKTLEVKEVHFMKKP